MHCGRDDQDGPNYPEQTVIEMQKLSICVDLRSSCKYQEVPEKMTDHKKEHHDPSQSHYDLFAVRRQPETHHAVRMKVRRCCTHLFVPPLSNWFVSATVARRTCVRGVSQSEFAQGDAQSLRGG